MSYRNPKTGRWAKRGIKKLSDWDVTPPDFRYKINQLIDVLNSLTAKEEKKEEHMCSECGWIDNPDLKKEEKKVPYAEDKRISYMSATFGDGKLYRYFPDGTKEEIKSEPSKPKCEHMDEEGFLFREYTEFGEKYTFCPLCGTDLENL